MSDLISRQAALDALEWKWAGKAAIDAIKNLPSAQPEQRIGKWILYGRGMAGCSQCGMIYNDVYDDDSYFNFCPNCGVKMEGMVRGNDK